MKILKTVPGGKMRKIGYAVLAASLSLTLSGCGKPPKDVAEKIAFNYVKDMANGYLEQSDIKFISSAAKDGGYIVADRKSLIFKNTLLVFWRKASLICETHNKFSDFARETSHTAWTTDSGTHLSR